MRRGRILKIFLGAGICLTAGIMVNHITSMTTTMCTEKELAGMSYTLQQYVDTQSAGAASDPEAIVAFPDDPAQNAPAAPGTDPNAPAVSDGAVAPEPTPSATPKPKSEYDKIGISVAADYVNVRKKPNTDSKVLGKLYRGSAATIREKTGDWVKIKSGQVEGYIKSDYLAIGFSAEKLVDKFGTKIATVNTETLKVREAKNTECAVLTLVSGEESFEVLREDKEWVKIMVDGDTKGFVSIEEEREEARKKAAAAAAAAREDMAQQQPSQPSSNSGSSGNSSNSGGSKGNSGGGSSSNKSGGGGSSMKGSAGKSNHSDPSDKSRQCSESSESICREHPVSSPV